MIRAIPYYRVSTERQGQSGLGLEAQQRSVHAYAQTNNIQLLEEFTEVESGRQDKRPVLNQALSACRKSKAVLLIAKLDRLSRNVMFISTLMNSKVDFIAVDNPHAEKMIIQIMAVFAEHERDQISLRPKNALRVAKARGVELGRYGKEVLSKKNHEASIAFAQSMQPVIRTLQKQGLSTVRELTVALNRKKIPTYRGGTHQWHLASVHQVLARLKALQNKK